MKIVNLNLIVSVCLSFSFMQCHDNNEKKKTLELVTELQMRPGNVVASSKGEVFATLHPLGGSDIQVLKVMGQKSHMAFPDESWQTPQSDTLLDENAFDSPLGLCIDRKNRLWIIDMGLRFGSTRLFAFDISTGEKVFSFTFPQEVAPKGSFIQDLAVDEVNGWAYLADISNPSILAVDINNKSVRRFSGHPSLQSEDVDMMIDGKVVNFGGGPARVAVNPITLSADNETLFFGAMNGVNWYAVSARLFREGKPDEMINGDIKRVGPKPVSDGASTDAEGNHFFTNLGERGIDMLAKGANKLTPLIRDKRLDWPDNVRFGKDSWLYIAVNQLYKTPPFTGGSDEGMPPFYIFRVWTGTKGFPGR